MASAKSILEAILYASPDPVPEERLGALLPSGSDVGALLAELSGDYEHRGLLLTRTARGVAMRTRQEASDLAAAYLGAAPRPTRAAFETLASIAIYDAMGTPLTRSEIERVRGVSLSPGITDTLLSLGYVKLGRRRETPGRPLTWVVTDEFHDAFGLSDIADMQAFVDMRDEGLAALLPLERLVQSEVAAEDGEGIPVLMDMAFTPDERERIDAAFDAAEADLQPLGLWPGRRGTVHLLHHRSVVRRVRGRDGGKLAHAEIAARSLAYARERGDVGLYATMAIAGAVSARWGAEGATRGAEAHPPLLAGARAFAGFTAHLRLTGPHAGLSPGTATATGEA